MYPFSVSVEDIELIVDLFHFVAYWASCRNCCSIRVISILLLGYIEGLIRLGRK